MSAEMRADKLDACVCSPPCLRATGLCLTLFMFSTLRMTLLVWSEGSPCPGDRRRRRRRGRRRTRGGGRVSREEKKKKEERRGEGGEKDTVVCGHC